MRGLISIFFLINLCVLSGCTQKKLNLDAYLTIANDHNGPFCVSQHIGNYLFELYYRPIEITFRHTINEESVDSLTSKSWKNQLYFLLRVVPLQTENKNCELDKNILELQQSNYDISSKILIQNCNNDSIGCNFALPVRDLQPGKEWNVLLAFPRKSYQGVQLQPNIGRIVIYEFGLSTGIVKFNLRSIHPSAILLKG